MEHIKFKNDTQMFLSCDYQMKANIYIINLLAPELFF